MKILNFIFFLAFFVSSNVYPIQDVYQYRDNKGHVEFTDQVKQKNKPVKHYQFAKETIEERAYREKNLEEIKKS